MKKINEILASSKVELYALGYNNEFQLFETHIHTIENNNKYEDIGCSVYTLCSILHSYNLIARPIRIVGDNDSMIVDLAIKPNRTSNIFKYITKEGIYHLNERFINDIYSPAPTSKMKKSDKDSRFIIANLKQFISELDTDCNTVAAVRQFILEYGLEVTLSHRYVDVWNNGTLSRTPHHYVLLDSNMALVEEIYIAHSRSHDGSIRRELIVLNDNKELKAS